MLGWLCTTQKDRPNEYLSLPIVLLLNEPLLLGHVILLIFARPLIKGKVQMATIPMLASKHDSLTNESYFLDQNITDILRLRKISDEICIRAIQVIAHKTSSKPSPNHGHFS